MISRGHKPLLCTGVLGQTHSFITERVKTEYWYHRGAWMEDMLHEIDSWFSRICRGYVIRILTCTTEGAREAFLAIPGVRIIDPISPIGKILDVPHELLRLRRTHPGDLIVVDYSISFGADRTDFRTLNADGYIFSPHGTLGSIPGLSVVAFRDSIRKHMQQHRSEIQPYTLSLQRYDIAGEKFSTPFSPDISANVGLAASLELIEYNGSLEWLLQRHAAYAKVIRAGIRKLGCKFLGKEKQFTNAFSIISLPLGISANTICSRLNHSRIGITALSNNTVRIGHMGFLTNKDIDRLLASLASSIGVKSPAASTGILPIAIPDTRDSLHKSLFSIPSKEWEVETKRAGKQRSLRYRQKLNESANILFSIPRRYDLYGCFRERTLGFIGAGKTVREAVVRCQAAGVSRILVFSPSLARLKKKGIRGSDVHNHKTLEYWESRGVEVTLNAKTVFLTAHTIILLPTFYNKQALALFGKPKEYLNERMINEKLLAQIEREGKMDLLINASAREQLIDRKALSRHLTRGWLRYISDELPPEDDPLLKDPYTLITGHIGGSCDLTKRRIAENSHVVLKLLVSQLKKGGSLGRTVKYAPNVVNAHLRPRKGWRAESGGTREVRILLTDTFDRATLNVPNIAKELGIPIVVHDMSDTIPTEHALATAFRSFRPHIVMVRTRAILTPNLARVMAEVHELSFVFRPGVGIDNLYSALRAASSLGIQVLNEPFGNSFAVGEMTTHFVLNGVRKILLSPGPSQYNQTVFSAIDAYTYSESPVFQKTFKSITQQLRKWAALDTVLVQSTPSTGFMEAAITNLTSVGDYGLIVSHGKFGNRFIQIAEATKRNAVILGTTDKEWGRIHNPKEIANFFKKKYLANKYISFLCLQQNETSTGIAYGQKHLQKIITAARKHNPDIIIIIDGVSGTFADDIDYSKLDVDAIVIGSQKGLGISSGIAFISLSKRAKLRMLSIAGYRRTWEALARDKKIDNFLSKFEKRQGVKYLSLPRLLLNRTILPPSVFHILSASVSLQELNREGGKKVVIKRHRCMRELCRKELKRLNIPTLSPNSFASNAVTPILLPSSAPLIRKELLAKHGFFVAGAQCEYLEPRLIRIGHVGYVDTRTIIRCLRALRILLQEYNLR